jgi:hypothetical protein
MGANRKAPYQGMGNQQELEWQGAKAPSLQLMPQLWH